MDCDALDTAGLTSSIALAATTQEDNVQLQVSSCDNDGVYIITASAPLYHGASMSDVQVVQVRGESRVERERERERGEEKKESIGLNAEYGVIASAGLYRHPYRARDRAHRYSPDPGRQLDSRGRYGAITRRKHADFNIIHPSIHTYICARLEPPPGLPTPPPGSGLAAPPLPPSSLSIILVGDNPLILDQCTLYVEPGALVLDEQGVNTVELLSIDDSQIDVEVPGTYTVWYTAEDSQVG